MTKYYNANIPTEIHFVYGGRHSGKTYYNFNKIKQENERLKEELKCFKHHYNIISKRCYHLLKELNVCVGCDNNPDYKKRIDKAIEYIENMPYAEVPDEDYENNHKMVEWNDSELLKILKGEENGTL